jgi:cytochrome c oxidase subunit 1
VFNFFYSIFKGRKVTVMNPYGATTLEWTAPIHPGHGNWEGDIPEVYRWPYDYSINGRDFIPQTEALGAGEEADHDHGSDLPSAASAIPGKH